MKNIYILLIFVLMLSSCKTKDVFPLKEESKPNIRQPMKASTESRKEPPRDLNDLIKQMALTEGEKELFLGFYEDAGVEVSNMLTLNLDKEEERKKRQSIYKLRDQNVRSILEPQQIRMYDRYLWTLSRRKKMNQSNGTQSNY